MGCMDELIGMALAAMACFCLLVAVAMARDERY